MKLSQDLSLKQVQTLKLTPQLQLAVKVLQANQIQLVEMIEQELMENPVLEVKQSDSEIKEIELPEASEKAQLVEYVKEFEKYFQESQDSLNSSGSFQSSATNEDFSSFEEWVADKVTLSDLLEEQLFLSVFNDSSKRIGMYIIAALDHNGWLMESVEKIAASLLCSVDQVERVLTLLQSFDPVGIAARDLKECLLIQYYQEEIEDRTVRLLIENHLEELANNRMKEISKALNVSFVEIELAYNRIKELNPRPASGYLHEVSTAEIIRPDLFVEVDDEEQLLITLNDNYLPNLNVNQYYQEKIQNAEAMDKEELIYLKRKLNSAIWFRQCIEKRRETISSVAKCIFEIQQDFFTEGVKGLKPLTLSDIAARVDRHEATVSRVINGKYAHTPVGIFELKFFFSGGLKSETGEMISSKRIKEIIQQAISEENPKKPLSDQVLADLLKARGIEIARRTVTKYREMLNIVSSSKRRKYT
ncbi:MAG: RNA polymerase sigma-54 factor [Candidatus Cloacimonadota bacterium]|nr:MAG: RNA polymerase sigma-54 factor [Candidatus Cloacimonadota bacterium]PCJ21028.1 MAG: RNA polymerase sigma-54 factor [Candidatus Cloacimonadota bacterium]